MDEFKPFENDTQTINVGPGNGITIENGKENIIIYGDIEINKETSPEDVKSLINTLEKIIHVLNKNQEASPKITIK